jgi:thioredoxin 1
MRAIVAFGKNRALRHVEPVQGQDERNQVATTATTETFEAEVLKSGGKVIVDFWAEWCGPCHAVSPVLDRIADEHDVKLVKVNIDEQQDLAQRYGVASIPFMVLFENGEPQASAVGAMPKGSLEKALGLAAVEA